MTHLRLDKITLALYNVTSWPRTARRLRALTDQELREAEEIERLTRRRTNLLRLLAVEHNRRAGKTIRAHHKLLVEASL